MLGNEPRRKKSCFRGSTKPSFSGISLQLLHISYQVVSWYVFGSTASLRFRMVMSMSGETLNYGHSCKTLKAGLAMTQHGTHGDPSQNVDEMIKVLQL